MATFIDIITLLIIISFTILIIGYLIIFGLKLKDAIYAHKILNKKILKKENKNV